MKVSAVLKQILTDQGRRTIDGQEAVRRILDEARKQIIGEIAAAPAGSFSSYRQTQMLGEINRLLNDAGSKISTKLNQKIFNSWEAGQDMLPQMAAAGSNITLTTFGLSSHVVDQIKEFADGKITSITNEIQVRIRVEITLGLLGQKSPGEIVEALAGTDKKTGILTSPGVFKGIPERAEVIVKTEMGRAFSMASQASMTSAADTLPDMKKMWLHAGHPKQPRPYHLRLNGDIKPVTQPFLVGNIVMMYPRDPTAPVSEIINCGCLHVPYMTAWGTKEEFLESWKQAQKAANKPKEK